MVLDPPPKQPLPRPEGSRLVGARIKRVEDRRLLAGSGSFTDDYRLPGLLHAVFVRAQEAHARIARVDTTRARTVNGVIAVVDGRGFRAGSLARSGTWERRSQRSSREHVASPRMWQELIAVEWQNRELPQVVSYDTDNAEHHAGPPPSTGAAVLGSFRHPGPLCQFAKIIRT